MSVLLQFLSHFNKNLVWRTEGFKTTYSDISVQLKQTELLSDTPKTWEQVSPQRSYHLPPDSSWLPPFLTFCLLLLVMPGAKCKIGLVLTTSQWKWMQMGIRSKPIANRKLRNSRLCCSCLPIIQSFVRCVCVCVCVCVEYLWTLNGLLPSHLRLPGEAPMVRGPWTHVHELEESLWLFCSMFVSSPGCV